MFHLSCHEWIGVLLEDSQTGAGAEIDPFAVIDGAGIFGWIFEYAATDSFVYWLRFGVGLSHDLFVFVL